MPKKIRGSLEAMVRSSMARAGWTRMNELGERYEMEGHLALVVERQLEDPSALFSGEWVGRIEAVGGARTEEKKKRLVIVTVERGFSTPQACAAHLKIYAMGWLGLEAAQFGSLPNPSTEEIDLVSSLVPRAKGAKS
jgi:hypothetical protein